MFLKENLNLIFLEATLMKIYTRTGDKGTTQLFGGLRVSKHHLRIDAYGTIDELNCFMGLLRDQVTNEEVREDILKIQRELFIIGSLLAAQPGKNNLTLPEISESSVKYLENRIDAMDGKLSPLKYFIIPGGHLLVSQAHICRTVCRRAERCITALHESEPGTVSSIILEYLNRLSDYLFILSRYIAQLNGVKEIPWIPEKK